MRIERTTELYSEIQRERWTSHKWYFLYKIITFFDVLVKTFFGHEGDSKANKTLRVSGKKQRKLRREKTAEPRQD